jgi:hypothetical protein
MSFIIAARFESWDTAGVAAQRLIEAGYPQESIHTFYVNSAGAHDRFPTGGDRASDPDSAGAQAGAWGGGALLGVVGAVIGAVVASVIGGNIYVLIIATGVGAYLGSLAGALQLAGRGRRKSASRGTDPEMTSASDPAYEHPLVRHAGVTLAVVLDPGDRARVAAILKQSGGVDVERAAGRWENGKWADFDPIKPPEPVDTPAVSAGAGQPAGPV